MKTLMLWLILKLEAWCVRRGRTLNISGTDDPENVYLMRRIVLSTKLFGIYVHRFMRSDKDDHHDHPFDFFGYAAFKGYIEEILTGQKVGRDGHILLDGQRAVGRRREGTWGFRRAETIHRVDLDRPYTVDEYKEAPLTIIFRGPLRRKWGFWTLFSICDGDLDYKWTHWKEYLDVTTDEVRE